VYLFATHVTAAHLWQTRMEWKPVTFKLSSIIKQTIYRDSLRKRFFLNKKYLRPASLWKAKLDLKEELSVRMRMRVKLGITPRPDRSKPD